MDKINALLIGIICILTGLSIYIIWDTVFREEPCAEGELAIGRACIAMNDDGQAINGSSQNMWFRARSGSDGEWVYSSCPAGPGEMTETMLPKLQEASGTDPVAHVYVEGIQTDWVGTDVTDAKTAFSVCKAEPLQHYKSSFL